MWCYQIPDFGAQVISQLQKQQQGSQFCDTMLRAEGVSIPAHSCILSALSPFISSALATTSPPPAGHTHLLEVRTMDACSLLNVVSLLYSGQMMGEGEKKKQEAFSAASKLGIRGLVEVTRSERRHRNQVDVTEAGVQTETEEVVEEWLRGETREGSSILQRDAPTDIWTQTEEVEVKVFPPPPPPQPEACYQTLDMSALQMEPYPSSPHRIPISVNCSTAENQPAPQPSPSEVPAIPSVIENTPVQLVQQPSLSDPNGEWDIVSEENHLQDMHFEQFEGNISGFINYFLDVNQERGSRGRRPRRQRGSGTRRGNTEWNLRERLRKRGGGQGCLTQTVDVQKVWFVGKMQKLFIHRVGLRLSSKGQGGGAVGRWMHLKTRALLNTSTTQRKNRVRCKEWDVSPSGDLRLCFKGRAGRGAQRGRRSAAQQESQLVNRDDLPASRERSKALATVTSPFSNEPVEFFDIETPPASGSVLQCSSSRLPAETSHTSLVPTLLPTFSVPHTLPTPPPSKQQLESINGLLEEVTVHDFLSSTGQLASGTGIITPISSYSSLFQHCPHGQAVSLQQTSEGVSDLNESTRSSWANEEFLLVQQECDGEMNQILEKFLQSFEQHIERAREGRDADSVSPIITSLFESPPSPLTAAAPHSNESQQGSSPPHSASMNGATIAIHSPAGSLTRGPLLPLEQNNGTVEDGDRKVDDEEDRLLRLTPVVPLERINVTPVKALGLEVRPPNPKDKDRERRSPTADRPRCDEGEQRKSRRVEHQRSDRQPLHSQTQHWESRTVTPPNPKQPRRRGPKRKSKLNVDLTDAVSAKKLIFDQSSSPISNSAELTAEPAKVEPKCKREPRTNKKSLMNEFFESIQKEVRRRGDEDIQSHAFVAVKRLPEHIVESAVSQQQEEEIDVMTATCPVPSPVLICWSDFSAGEEEDQDVDVE